MVWRNRRGSIILIQALTFPTTFLGGSPMAQSSTVWNARPVRVGLLAALVLGGAAACERGLTSSPEGPASAAAAEGAGAIAGRVLEAVSGAPVPGAVVSTPGGASTVTGPGGEFVIAGLAAAERLAATASAEG